MREEDGGSISVIWMHITDFHGLQFISVVVSLSILSLVLDLRPINKEKSN